MPVERSEPTTARGSSNRVRGPVSACQTSRSQSRLLSAQSQLHRSGSHGPGSFSPNGQADHWPRNDNQGRQTILSHSDSSLMPGESSTRALFRSSAHHGVGPHVPGYPLTTDSSLLPANMSPSSLRIPHGQHYHGPVNFNYIASSQNTFSGTSYGPVVQNSADDDIWMDSLASKLKISYKADYGYYPGGNEAGLRRSSCTKGTRIEVIEGAIHWGLDKAPHSESVYWLSGQAGAGKTTIAHTLSDYFANNPGGVTVLGGSFFCSRHSPETRSPAFIIRTLVYRLALRSTSFRAALRQHGNFETVDHDPWSQLNSLLLTPWRKCEEQRRANNEPCMVNIIDALDELDGEGGIEFLTTLLDVLNEGRLSGLKFFVTSRLEPSLVQRIEAFDKKQVFRLERMPIDESSADIRLYLGKYLGKIATQEEIEQLVADVAGILVLSAK